MKLFIDFFNCGTIHQRSNPNTPRCDYLVQNINDILEHIIPHFDTYPLLNLKQRDYIICVLRRGCYSSNKRDLYQNQN